MKPKEEPRAILQKMTLENLAKMREIAQIIVQADQQGKTDRTKVLSPDQLPSEQRSKR